MPCKGACVGLAGGCQHNRRRHKGSRSPWAMLHTCVREAQRFGARRPDFQGNLRSCLEAPGTSRINTPTLVLWDLNGIEFKGTEAQMQTQIQHCVAAMKSILVLQGTYGLGIVIHRRNPPGNLSRRAFHNTLSSTLKQFGMDCDLDLAFNYKRSTGHRRRALPDVLPGWLVFLQSLAENMWMWSNVVQGSITDLEPSSMKEMALSVDC